MVLDAHPESSGKEWVSGWACIGSGGRTSPRIKHAVFVPVPWEVSIVSGFSGLRENLCLYGSFHVMPRPTKNEAGITVMFTRFTSSQWLRLVGETGESYLAEFQISEGPTIHRLRGPLCIHRIIEGFMLVNSPRDPHSNLFLRNFWFAMGNLRRLMKFQR